MNRKMPLHNQGFTLSELLVGVSIISVIVVSIMLGGTYMFRRARALQIADDFRRLETAWKTYQVDVSILPKDTEYNRRKFCDPNNNVEDISKTHLYHGTNLKKGLTDPDIPIPQWNGPYMTEILRDPWGQQEYGYDNDPGTIFYPDTCTGPTEGANITLDWCNTPASGVGPETGTLIEIIDEIIDNGDGAACGKFHWSPQAGWYGGGGGRMFYVISNESGNY